MFFTLVAERKYLSWWVFSLVYVSSMPPCLCWFSLCSMFQACVVSPCFLLYFVRSIVSMISVLSFTYPCIVIFICVSCVSPSVSTSLITLLCFKSSVFLCLLSVCLWWFCSGHAHVSFSCFYHSFLHAPALNHVHFFLSLSAQSSFSQFRF